MHIRLASLTAGALLALAAAPAAGRAQTATTTPATAPVWGHHHHGHHGHGDPFARLAHFLDLTDAQKAQLAPIFQAAQPQLKAIHDEARAKAKVVLQGVQTQITPYLTADQLQALEVLQKRMARHQQQAAASPAGQ